MSRKSVRIAAREAMQKFGYDPLEVLVQYATAENRSDDDKRDVALALLPYAYPKLSNITVEGELSTNPVANHQAELFRRFMENPELADAAQRLSIAAAEAALESETSGAIH